MTRLNRLAMEPASRAVLDALREGVMLFDHSGHLVHANRVAMGVLRQSTGGEQGAQGNGAAAKRILDRATRVAPVEVNGVRLGEVVFIEPGAGPETLAERERQAIIDTLERTGWRRTAAAKHLGISRTTLWRRLKQYGLDQDAPSTWTEPS